MYQEKTSAKTITTTIAIVWSCIIVATLKQRQQPLTIAVAQ
jgi:hypothetical protein